MGIALAALGAVLVLVSQVSNAPFLGLSEAHAAPQVLSEAPILPQAVSEDAMVEIDESNIILRDLNTSPVETFASTESGGSCGAYRGGVTACPNASYNASSTPIENQILFPLTTSEAVTVTEIYNSYADPDVRKYTLLSARGASAVSDWWLRSPGDATGKVAYVDGSDGSVVTDGALAIATNVKAPRMSMFATIPSGANSLTVGACRDNDNSCIKMYSATYQAGAWNDNWAKFDIIGINDGVSKTGTCRLDDGSPSSNSLTSEKAYQGYTMPGQSQVADALTQCPPGSMQLLMSENYAFNSSFTGTRADLPRLPTKVDLAGNGSDTDNSCLYVYAKYINTATTGSVACALSTLSLGDIGVRFRITKDVDLPFRFYEYRLIEWLKGADQITGLAVNTDNYLSGLNKTDFFVVGGSQEAGDMTLSTETPAVCVPDTTDDMHISEDGKIFRARLVLVGAGTCTVKVTKAATTSHTTLEQTQSYEIHSVTYNPMDGVLNGTLNPRYFYNYTYEPNNAAEARNGIRAIPTVTPNDPDMMFAGWCWQNEDNDDVCDYGQAFWWQYVNSSKVIISEKPYKVRASATPVAIIRPKMQVRFHYGSVEGAPTTPGCSLPIDESGCEISKPVDQTIPEGYSFEQFMNKIYVMPDTTEAAKTNYATGINYHDAGNVFGYTFRSWNTQDECQGDIFNFADTPVTADVDLYACWKAANTPRNCGFRFQDDTLPVDGNGEQTGVPVGTVCSWDFNAGQPLGILTIQDGYDITITEDLTATHNDPVDYLANGWHVIVEDNITSTNTLTFDAPGKPINLFYPNGFRTDISFNALRVNQNYAKVDLVVTATTTLWARSTCSDKAAIRSAPSGVLSIKGAGQINAHNNPTQIGVQWGAAGIGADGAVSSNIGTINITDAINVSAYASVTRGNVDANFSAGAAIGCAAACSDANSIIDIDTSGYVFAQAGRFGAATTGQWGTCSAAIGSGARFQGNNQNDVTTIKIHGTGKVVAKSLTNPAGGPSSVGIGIGGQYSNRQKSHLLKIDIYENPTVLADGGNGTNSGQGMVAIGFSHYTHTIAAGSYIKILGGVVIASAVNTLEGRYTPAAIGTRGDESAADLSRFSIIIENANVFSAGGDYMDDFIGTDPPIQNPPITAVVNNYSPSIYPFPKNLAGERVAPFYVPKSITTTNDALNKWVNVPVSGSSNMLNCDYLARTADLNALQSSAGLRWVSAIPDLAGVFWLPVKSTDDTGDIYRFVALDSDLTELEGGGNPEMQSLLFQGRFGQNTRTYPTFATAKADDINILKPMPNDFSTCSFDIVANNGETSPEDYTCNMLTLHIKRNADLTISDSTDYISNPFSGHEIKIDDGIDVHLSTPVASQLVVIPYQSRDISAIEIGSGSSLSLCLAPTSLVSVSSTTKGQASIHVPETSSFTLEGVQDGCGTAATPPAILSLQSGVNYGGLQANDLTEAVEMNTAAGIGANPYEGWGKITLNGSLDAVGFSTSAAVGGASCWLKSTALNSLGGYGCPDITPGIINIAGKVRAQALNNDTDLFMAAAAIGGGANWSGKVQNSGAINITEGAEIAASTWEPFSESTANRAYRFSGAPIGQGGFGGSGISNRLDVVATTAVLDGQSNHVEISGGLVMARSYKRNLGISDFRTAGIGRVENPGFENLTDSLTVKITSGQVFPQNSTGNGLSVAPQAIGYYDEAVYPAYLQRFVSNFGMRLAYCNVAQKASCTVDDPESFKIDTTSLNQFAIDENFYNPFTTPAYVYPNVDLSGVLWLPGADTDEGIKYSDSLDYRFIYYAKLTDLDTNFINAGSSRAFGIDKQRARVDNYIRNMTYNIITSTVIFHFKSNNGFVGGTYDQGWRDPNDIENPLATSDLFIGQQVQLNTQLGLLHSTLPKVGQKVNSLTFMGWYYEQATLLGDAGNNFVSNKASSCSSYGMLERVTEETYVRETNEAYYGTITFYGCWLDRDAPVAPAGFDVSVPNQYAPNLQIVVDTTDDIDDVTDHEHLQYCIRADVNMAACGTTAQTSADGVTGAWNVWNDGFNTDQISFTYNGWPRNTIYFLNYFVRDLANNSLSIQSQPVRLLQLAYNKQTGAGTAPQTQYVLYPGSLTIPSGSSVGVPPASPTGTETHFLAWCTDALVCANSNMYYEGDTYTPAVNNITMSANYKYNQLSGFNVTSCGVGCVLLSGLVPNSKYAIYDNTDTSLVRYATTGAGVTTAELHADLVGLPDVSIQRIYPTAANLSQAYTNFNTKPSDAQSFSADLDILSAPAITASATPYSALTNPNPLVTITPVVDAEADITIYTIDGSTPTCDTLNGTEQEYLSPFGLNLNPNTTPTRTIKAITCDAQNLKTDSAVTTRTFSLAGYTVKFDANTSATAPPADQTIYYGGNINLNMASYTPAPPSGYTFQGWYTWVEGGSAYAPIKTGKYCTGTQYYDIAGNAVDSRDQNITANVNLYACFLDKTAPTAGVMMPFTTPNNGQMRVVWERMQDIGNVSLLTDLRFTVKYALEDCSSPAAWAGEGSCLGLTTFASDVANITYSDVNGLINGVTYYFKIIAKDLADNVVQYPTASSAVYRIQYLRGAAAATGTEPATAYVIKGANYTAAAFPLVAPAGVGFNWWCKGADILVVDTCPDEAAHVSASSAMGAIDSNWTLNASYGLSQPKFTPLGSTTIAAASQTITITHDLVPAPDIYYTIDGSTPTCAPVGTKYLAPFAINFTQSVPSVIVRAIACDPNARIASSLVYSQTYTLVNRTVTFNLNGGLLDNLTTPPPNQIVPHGGLITNPVADVSRLTKANYTFQGWYSGSQPGSATATACSGTQYVDAVGTVNPAAPVIAATAALYACWLDKAAPNPVVALTSPTSPVNGKQALTIAYAATTDVGATPQANLQYRIVIAPSAAGTPDCATGTALLNWTANKTTGIAWAAANQVEGNNFLSICVRDQAGNIVTSTITVNILAKVTFDANTGSGTAAGGATQYFDVSAGAASLEASAAAYSGAKAGWTFQGWMLTPPTPPVGWATPSNSATTCNQTTVGSYPYSVDGDKAFVACWLDETEPARIAATGFSPSTARIDNAPITLTIPTTTDESNVTPAAQLQYKVLKSPTLGGGILQADSATGIIQDWTARSGASFNISYTTALGLQIGENYITVYARDLAGNINQERTFTITVGANFTTALALARCATTSAIGACDTPVSGTSEWRVDNANLSQKVRLTVTVSDFQAGYTLSGRGYIGYSNRGTGYSGETGQLDALSCSAWTQIAATNQFYCDIALVQSLNTAQAATTISAFYDGDAGNFNYKSSTLVTTATPERIPTKVIVSTKGADGKSTIDAASIQLAVVPSSCSRANTAADTFTLDYLKAGTGCLFSDNGNGGGTILPAALSTADTGQKYFTPTSRVTFKLSATGVTDANLTCTFDATATSEFNYEMSPVAGTTNASLQICTVTPSMSLSGTTSNAFRSGSTWTISDIAYNITAPPDHVLGSSAGTNTTFNITKVSPVLTVITAGVTGLTSNDTVPISEPSKSDTVLFYLDLPVNLYSSQLTTARLCATLDYATPVESSACTNGQTLYPIGLATALNKAEDVDLPAADGLPAKPLGVVRWAYRLDLLHYGSILPGTHNVYIGLLGDELLNASSIVNNSFNIARVTPTFIPFITATDWDLSDSAQDMHAFQQEFAHGNDPAYGTDGSNPNSITWKSVTSETTNNRFYIFTGPDESRGLNEGTGPIGDLSAPCTTASGKVDKNCFDSHGSISVAAYVDSDGDGLLSALEIAAGDIFNTDCKDLPLWDDLYLNDGFGVAACDFGQLASGQYILRATMSLADSTQGTFGVDFGRTDQIMANGSTDYLISIGANPATFVWDGTDTDPDFAIRNANNYAAQVANVWTASNAGMPAVDETIGGTACGTYGSTAITASTFVYNDEAGDPVTVGDLIAFPEGLGKLGLGADQGTIAADGTFNAIPNGVADIIEKLNLQRQCHKLKGTLYSYSAFNAADVLAFSSSSSTESSSKVNVTPAGIVTDAANTCGSQLSDDCHAATFELTLPQFDLASAYTGLIDFIGHSASDITQTTVSANLNVLPSDLLHSAWYAKNAEASIPCIYTSATGDFGVGVSCPAHKNSYYLRSTLDFVPPGLVPKGHASFSVSACTNATLGQECNTTTPVTNGDSGFNGTYEPEISYNPISAVIAGHAYNPSGHYTLSFRTMTDPDLNTLAMGKLAPGIYQVCGQYKVSPFAAILSFVNSSTNCYRINVTKVPALASFASNIVTTTASPATSRVLTVSVDGAETAPILPIITGKVNWKICTAADFTSNAQNCSAASIPDAVTSGSNLAPTSSTDRTFTIPISQIYVAGSYKLVAIFTGGTNFTDAWAATDLTVSKVNARAVINNCAPTENMASAPTQGLTYTGNTNTYATCDKSMLYAAATTAISEEDIASLAARGLSGSSAYTTYINSNSRIYMSAASPEFSGSLTNATLAADSTSANYLSNPPVQSSGSNFVLNYYNATGARIATQSEAISGSHILGSHMPIYGSTRGVAKGSAFYGFTLPEAVANVTGTYYVLACWTGDAGYNFDCYDTGGGDYTASDFKPNETLPSTGTFDFTSNAVAAANLSRMRQITVNKAPYGDTAAMFVSSAGSDCSASTTPDTLSANQYLCLQVSTAKTGETDWNAAALDNNAPGAATVQLRNDAVNLSTAKTCSTWTRRSANTYTCIITLAKSAGETFTSTNLPNARIDLAATSIFAASTGIAQTLAVSKGNASYYMNVYSDSTNFSYCATGLTIACDAVHVAVKVGSSMDASGVAQTGNIWASGDVKLQIEQCDPTMADCDAAGATNLDITTLVLSSANVTLSGGAYIFNLSDALSELEFAPGKYRFRLISYSGDSTFAASSSAPVSPSASKTVDFAATNSHINSKLTLGSALPGSDISQPETAIVGQSINVMAIPFRYSTENLVYGGEICQNMVNDATATYSVVVKNAAGVTKWSSASDQLAAVTLNCTSTPSDLQYTIQKSIPAATFDAAGNYTITIAWSGNDSYAASSTTRTIAMTKVLSGSYGHVSHLVVKPLSSVVTTTTSLNQVGNAILKVPTGVSPLADSTTAPTKGYIDMRFFEDEGVEPNFNTDYMPGFASSRIPIATSDKMSACPDPTGVDLGFDCYEINFPMPKYINTIGEYLIRAQYTANDSVESISTLQADDITAEFAVSPGQTELSADAAPDLDMLNTSSQAATVHLASTEYAALENRCSDGSTLTEIPGDPPTYTCATGTFLPAGVPDATKTPTNLTNGTFLWQIWAIDAIGSQTNPEMLRSGSIVKNGTGYTNVLTTNTAVLGEMATYSVPLGTYTRPGEYALRYAFCSDAALEDAHDVNIVPELTCANSTYFELEYTVDQPPSYVRVNFDANVNGKYCQGDADCLADYNDGTQTVTFFVPQGTTIGAFPTVNPYTVPVLTTATGYNFLGYASDNPPVWEAEDEEDSSTWMDVTAALPSAPEVNFHAQYSTEPRVITTDQYQYIHEEYIDIEGEGFAPNQALQIGISNGDSVDFLELTTITTEADGTFDLNWNIPNRSSISTGIYQIVARDARVGAGTSVDLAHPDGAEIEIVPTLEQVVIADEVAFADGGADETGHANLSSKILLEYPGDEDPQPTIYYELSQPDNVAVAECGISETYNDTNRPAMHLTKSDKSVVVSAIACLPNGAYSVPKQFTFTLNTYTLSFEGNGGELPVGATMDSIEIAQNDEFALPENVFEAPEDAENYLGWAVSESAANAANPTIAYFDAADFVAPAADVTLWAIWRPLPQTPAAYIHFIDETLCGLAPHTTYDARIMQPVVEVGGLRVQNESLNWRFATNSEGCTPLREQWLGEELIITQSIVYGTSSNQVTLTSQSQALPVSARPDMPSAVVISHEIEVGSSNGIIGSVGDTLEWRYCGEEVCAADSTVAWQRVGEGLEQLEQLPHGLYQVRVAAQHNAEEPYAEPESAEPQFVPLQSQERSAFVPLAAPLHTWGNFASVPQVLEVQLIISPPPTAPDTEVPAPTGTSPWGVLLLMCIMLGLALCVRRVTQ